MRKLKWALIGILALEVVLFNAWTQWRDAKKLSASVKAKGSFPVKNWTIAHSFFAEMGGFAIVTRPNSPEEREFVHSSPRLTVTSRGVLLLAKHGCLPDVSLETIMDKSKADAIAKSLVCLQAGWMVIQCITRLANRLLITLLEITTLGHLSCALMMYFFWWNKPLDIGDPLIISRPHIRQMAAFLVEGSAPRLPNYVIKRKIPTDTNPITWHHKFPEPSRVCQELSAEASPIFGVSLDEHRSRSVEIRSLNWPKG
ncbi:MAG: hypothetical protein M1813_001743 [Trichoglossum hirsutum]|nr:MAG: hypothetical protein M1813_001743 [Trichoglossum hirsutum]